MTEEYEPYGEVGIGLDKPQVEAKRVVLEKYSIEIVLDKSDPSKEIGRKIVFHCKHPDIEDRLIEVSSAKYSVGDKLKVTGMWWKEDSGKKIPFKSAIANVLRHYKKENIKSLVGDQLDTLTDNSGYLVIKAY